MTGESFKEECAQARCRSCGAAKLLPVLDLGDMPLTSAFVGHDRLGDVEPKYPLQIGWCASCCLMQVLKALSPQVIFHNDYPYYSSFSAQMQAHASALADQLIAARKLRSSSLVIELASNDGYFLRHFVQRGVGALGIDPASGPAATAQAAGVETLVAFFSTDLAAELVRAGRKADVVAALNVLAHVPNINDFVAGMRLILKEQGVAVIEVPYIRNLIERCEFDTIYHEHVFYHSLTSLDALFRRHEIFVNAVEPIAMHGGSLRVTVSHDRRAEDSVRALLAEERDIGLLDFAYYADFARRVAGVRESLRQMVADLTATGNRIAAYGAAAKGVILLNYAGIDAQTVTFVADRNVHKHGKYMPGLRIPVLPADSLLKLKPDVVLLLAWNFADEILRQQQAYRDSGGRFLIPVPVPRLI